MSETIAEAVCRAHARRKFFDLHAANKGAMAQRALEHIGQMYELERQAKDMDGANRLRLRQEQSAQVVKTLHGWLMAQTGQVPEGSATARAMD